MKKQKISSYIITALFVGLLVFIMIITVITPKKTESYYENRALSEFPEFSKQSFIDGKYSDEVESFLIDHCAFRETMEKLDIWFDIILKRPMINDVVIKNDMLLSWNMPELVNKNEIETKAKTMADNLLKLNNIVENYGGYFCYTLVPCQYIMFQDEYPFYLNNRKKYTDASMSAFTKYMKENNLEFIDMGKTFKKLDNRDFYYSKTDNHYTIYGAYETYRNIIEKINSDTDLNLEFPKKDDDIVFQEVPSYYLGSRARQLMNLKKGNDKLFRANFKKDIPFTRTDNSITSESTVYPQGPNEYNHVLYSYYMGGDIGETVIDTNREDLPSVLIYGDSFTNPLECLMYYSFNEMRSVDLRHYNEMSLEEYIKIYKPDVVICIRDYESLISLTGNGDFFN